jgi:hypothetical protein
MAVALGADWVLGRIAVLCWLLTVALQEIRSFPRNQVIFVHVLAHPKTVIQPMRGVSFVRQLSTLENLCSSRPWARAATESLASVPRPAWESEVPGFDAANTGRRQH